MSSKPLLKARRAVKGKGELRILHPQTNLRMSVVALPSNHILHLEAKVAVSTERWMSGDYREILDELHGKRLLNGAVENHWVTKGHPSFEIYTVGINGQPAYLQLMPNFSGGPR